MMDYEFISYEPILIGEWWVQISKSYGLIQVFMWNMYSFECAINWFEDPYESYAWIDYMSAKIV